MSTLYAPVIPDLARRAALVGISLVAIAHLVVAEAPTRPTARVLRSGARRTTVSSDGRRAPAVAVRSIRPSSLLARLGLRDGDVITRIDGLAGGTRPLEIYAGLRRAPRIGLGIERDGRPITLRYTVRRDV